MARPSRCWRTSARSTSWLHAVEKGAEGVGLFRTEFLFLDSDERADASSEQQADYTALFEAFPGKKVVVRALDAGADKPLTS